MKYRMYFRVTALCLVILTLVAGSFAVTALKVRAAVQASYYVSPTGSDSNDGLSAGTPFLTLAHARDVVQPLTANMSGDITINLLDGTYTLASTLNFGSSDSGTSGHNVIWQANGYGSSSVAHPVVSGGQQISGWSLADSSKNIWQANVDASLQTRQLYVNGVRAQRATAGTAIPGTVTQTATGYTTTDSSLQSWKNPQNIEFVYSGGSATSGSLFQEPRCDVSSISASGSLTVITMQQPCYANGTSSSQGSANQITLPTTIENAYELLNSPGQWYLDNTGAVAGSAKVYYIPRADEDLGTATVIVPKVETLVEGQGTLVAPVHNIQFKGLTFAYGTWLQPSSSIGFIQNQADSLLVAINPLVYIYEPGNVAFHTAQNILFERNVFTHLGTDGLVLDQGVQNSVVLGNVFTDTSGTGLRLGDTKPINATGNAQNKNNSITNNYIHDIAVEYHGDDGFRNVYSIGTNFAHNEIAHVPYDGIEVGNQCESADPSYSTDDHFSYNYIHNVMEDANLSDGGGIYADAIYPNTSIDHNFFDYDQNAGPYGGTIYTDCYASGYVAASNVVTHSRLRWLQASNVGNTIRDNFTDSTQYENPSGNTLINNQMGLTTLPAAAQTIISNAGIEAAYQDIKQIGNGGTTTVDDSIQGSGQSQFNYAGGGWGHCLGIANCGDPAGFLFQDSNSYDNVANDAVTFAFTGTKIAFYAVVDPAHGQGAVSIDGGSETTLDFYAATRKGNVLLWTSSTLSAGSHTFKLRVTGTKDASSSDYYNTVDRVVITG